MPTPPSHPLTPAAAHAPARPAAPGAGPLVAIPVMLLRVGLLAAAAAACFAVARAQDPAATLAHSQVWMNLAIIAVDLVCLMTLARVLRQEGSSLRRLLATATWVRDALLGLAVFVPVAVAFFAGNFLANLIVYQGPPPAATGPAPQVPLFLGVVSLVVMPVTIAVAEESVYRAYALPRLERWGRPAAVLVSALVFGSQHVFLSLGSTDMMLARFLTTFFAGLAFGLAWYLLKGRVWTLVVAHWLLDALFLGVPMLMLAMG